MPDPAMSRSCGRVDVSDLAERLRQRVDLLDFPVLAPESSDEHDHYFRCPDCGELFAVGTWLKNGNLIECDVLGCNGQFYAKVAPPEPPGGADGQSTGSVG